MRERVEIRRTEGMLVARLAPAGGGCSTALGVLLLLASLAGMLLAGAPEGTLVFAVLAFLGLLPLLHGLVAGRAAWRVEIGPETAAFVREGLFGERRRAWPAWDVASFWVDPRRVHGDASSWALRIGFRNGREEYLVEAAEAVDIVRIGEALRDRPKAVVPHEVAAARPRALPPDLLPASVRLGRLQGGFGIDLLPRGGVALRVVLPTLLACAAMAAFAALMPPPSGAVLGTVWTGAALALGVASGKKRLARARVLVQNDAVEVEGAGRWLKADVEHVQTLAVDGGTELQLFLRGRPKARLLRGRPAGELEWLARFLRAALRGVREELRVEAREGTCQICGEAMTERVVVCARCRTPHHAECWTYTGQCATYGCREIRCL